MHLMDTIKNLLLVPYMQSEGHATVFKLEAWFDHKVTVAVCRSLGGFNSAQVHQQGLNYGEGEGPDDMPPVP